MKFRAGCNVLTNLFVKVMLAARSDNRSRNFASLATQQAEHNRLALRSATVDLSTPTGEDIPIEERDSREVTHVRDHQLTPEGVEVHNFAFDVTPNELIAAIITDRGVARAPYTESLRNLVTARSASAT